MSEAMKAICRGAYMRTWEMEPSQRLIEVCTSRIEEEPRSAECFQKVKSFEALPVCYGHGDFDIPAGPDVEYESEELQTLQALYEGPCREAYARIGLDDLRTMFISDCSRFFADSPPDVAQCLSSVVDEFDFRCCVQDEQCLLWEQSARLQPNEIEKFVKLKYGQHARSLDILKKVGRFMEDPNVEQAVYEVAIKMPGRKPFTAWISAVDGRVIEDDRK